MARIKVKQGIPPRPASGTRKQTAVGKASRTGTLRPPIVPSQGLTANASKPAFKRFNENDYGNKGDATSGPNSALQPSQSNRLLGNRQAFLNQTDQAVNQDANNPKLRRENTMSNSTKAFSEDPVAAAALPPGQMVGPDGKVMQMPDIANPHANLELTEEELEEIYSRPYMNPAHA